MAVEFKDVELEVKCTLIAVVYAFFKLIEDYIGVIPGSPLYDPCFRRVGRYSWVRISGCTCYICRGRVASIQESLSAMSKLQQRKSLKITLRWIYLRAVVVGAVHVFT